MTQPIVLGVTDFVAVLNQTLDYAYPQVAIVGELANLRVSKGKWLYFDLKDEQSSVKFFGTVYQLPGPLQDGMMLQATGTPRLHPQFGFSVTVQSLQPIGEGSLKKAADLLLAKLEAEGLFAPERKRLVPYPPARIGLITSSESAAYADFIKILQARWGGVQIVLFDVQVQGEPAVSQIVQAIAKSNAMADTLDTLVITRGGGSSDDLAVFNNEQVVRAVAASVVPTVVAIGHEIDVSLAELAADVRASTPSNAAELLVPSKSDELLALQQKTLQLQQLFGRLLQSKKADLLRDQHMLDTAVAGLLNQARTYVHESTALLAALSPNAVMGRGYAIVRSNGSVVHSASQLLRGDTLDVQLRDGTVQATVQ